MLSFNTGSKFLGAMAVSAGLLAAPAAQAEWHRGGWGDHDGWRRPEFHGGFRRGPGIGPVIAGTVLGLGAAALVAGAIAPPPAYYAPPQAYYAPPPVVYAQPPAYAYAPPPAYYAPGYGY